MLAVLAFGLAPRASGLHAQQAPESLAQPAIEWELPTIDPAVAGRLAQLCALREGTDSASSERLVAALLDNPQRLLEGLASAYQYGAWRVPAERGTPPVVWQLTRERAAVLSELAARLPVRMVVERSEQALASAGQKDQRSALLILLGTVARAKDVPLLIDLAAAGLPEQDQAEFERALGQTLARDARGCREVEGRWKQTPQALRASVLRALSASGQNEALLVLAAAAELPLECVTIRQRFSESADRILHWPLQWREAAPEGSRGQRYGRSRNRGRCGFMAVTFSGAR
jgi:hypothetical protein